MSTLSVFVVTPELIFSLIAGTLGFSILKSGVTKGELMVDLPLMASMLAGIYHDLTLNETGQMVALAVADFVMAVTQGSEVGYKLFSAAIVAWGVCGMYLKTKRIMIDVKNTVIPI